MINKVSPSWYCRLRPVVAALIAILTGPLRSCRPRHPPPMRSLPPSVPGK